MAFNAWTFTINEIIIPNGWEPIGWDKVKFTLRRATNDIGYDFTFSDTLEFDGLPAQIVRAAYQAEFIDAYVPIVIEHCQGWRYSGVINFSLYKEKGGFIAVGIKESSFSNLFTNRFETPVDLSKEIGLEGNTLTPITPIDLPLHSKELFFTAQYKINSLLKSYFWFEEDQFSVPPFEIITADIEEALSPNSYDPNNPLFYSGFTYPAGVENRTLRIRGRVKFSLRGFDALGGPAPSVFVRIGVSGVQSEIVYTSVDSPTQSAPNGATAYVDYSFDQYFSFPPDSNFYVQIVALSNGGFFDFDDELSFITMDEASVFPASTAKSYLVFEAINRILESITGQSDVLRSDFLGRIDSVPFHYSEDGQGALIALTNGFGLRKFGDKPVVTSFKEVFDALNTIHNLGLRLEGRHLRIEPKAYFYRLNGTTRFSFIADLQENPSLSDVYSEVEFDYQNQGDTKQLNKLDEFNTKRSYVLPIRQHKNKLELRTTVITSGYAIEFTRRQQFSTNGTTDYPTDNNLFLIACLRDGTIIRPERDERYQPITGILSPSTSYNLRFSPVRCLLRWRKVFGGCLFRSTDQVAKFVSGTGNYLMESAGIRENAHIEVDAANALFQPIEVLFQYPMTFGEFLDLKLKAIESIAYSCSNQDYKQAFIREVSYEPNQEGGIASFKLIMANPARNESAEDL
jgi:hypothetical protein